MKSRSTIRNAGLCVCLAIAEVALVPAAARADVTRDQCVDANTKAQSLRRDGKLSEARAELNVCSDSHCPSIVRSDCTERLDELDRVQPTIVFSAKDSAGGGDVTDVRVTIDGRPFVERLDGRAVDVDPGEHTFTFATASGPVVTQKFVFFEGEKARRERVVLGPSGGAPAAPEASHAAPASGAPATPPASGAISAAPDVSAAATGPQPARATGGEPPYWTGRRVIGVAAGGLGVVAMGVSAILAASAKSQFDTASTESGSMRHDDSVKAVNTGNVATALFVGGAAVASLGVVFWLTAPSASAQVGTNGRALFLQGTF